MKRAIRTVGRRMAGWPVIGRLIRTGIGIIRLPLILDFYFQSRTKMEADRAQSEAQLARYRTFETEQLPTILETVAGVNQQLLQYRNSQDNLTKSAPLALRSLTRDVVHLRQQLTNVHSLEQNLADVKQAVSELQSNRAANAIDENLARSIPIALRTLTRDLADMNTKFDDSLKYTDSSVQSLRSDALTGNQRAEDNYRHLNQLSQSVEYLLGRVEFVRRELMFEMRYGTSSPSQEEALRTTSEIINTDKIKSARKTGIRLNLGCGHVPIDGYVNVDRRALPDVDVVAEVDDLPFAENEVFEIFSAHMLEHFPQEQLRRTLLPYWYKLLKKGGVFRAIVPDGNGMINAYKSGEYTYDTFRKVTYGGQDYDGDFHYNMFSTASLSELLQEAGFTDVKIIAENRENGGCKEFEICAIHP